MKFQIVKQEDKSLALEVPDDLLQQLTSPSSSGTEAQLEKDKTNRSLAELQEKLTAAEGKTMDDFTPLEKSNFVLAWGKGLSDQQKAIFAEAVGIPITVSVAEAVEAEKAAEGAEVAEVTGERIIRGKTDLPGYKYLEHVNMSIKEA